MIQIDNPWQEVKGSDLPIEESFIIHRKGDEKFVYCKCNAGDNLFGKRSWWVDIASSPRTSRVYPSQIELEKDYDYWMPYFALPSELDNECRRLAANIETTIFIKKSYFAMVVECGLREVAVSLNSVNRKRLLNEDGSLKQLKRIVFHCRDCEEESRATFSLEEEGMAFCEVDGARAISIRLKSLLKKDC